MDDATKQCRGECGRTLALAEFYKDRRGVAYGSCKTCVNARTKCNREARKSDPEWVVKEAERLRQSMRRRWPLIKDRPDVREQRRRAVEKWRRNNPEKKAAHNAVSYAIRTGKLAKPSTCATPGCNSGSAIHAHHDDYSKPLEVRWLCHQCHERAHHVTDITTDGT